MLIVRIAYPPDILTKTFKEHERKFYLKCAEIVYSFLKSPKVQSLITQVMKEESIDTKTITNVRIMRFPNPDRPEQAGTYNEKTGVIGIYPRATDPEPPAIGFLETVSSFNSFIKKEAVNSLIHEILHTKYNRLFHAGKITRVELEILVKELTLEYLEYSSF